MLVAYGTKVYTSISRPIPTANLSRSRLKELKQHKSLVENHEELDSLETISKTFTVMKFLDQLPIYLRNSHGVSKVSLAYVIRNAIYPPTPLPTLRANKPWGITHSNLMEELITCTPHTGPSYEANNSRVFSILSKALTWISAMPSIAQFQRARNGRSTYLDLVMHHMGLSKWEKWEKLLSFF